MGLFESCSQNHDEGRRAKWSDRPAVGRLSPLLPEVITFGAISELKASDNALSGGEA